MKVNRTNDELFTIEIIVNGTKKPLEFTELAAKELYDRLGEKINKENHENIYFFGEVHDN